MLISHIQVYIQKDISEEDILFCIHEYRKDGVC